MVGELTGFADLADPTFTAFLPGTLTRNRFETRFQDSKIDDQSPPPKKRQRKSLIQGTRKASRRSGLSSDDVRRAHGSLEWFDKEDDRWSKST